MTLRIISRSTDVADVAPGRPKTVGSEEIPRSRFWMFFLKSGSSGCFQKLLVPPKWLVYNGLNLIKMDDLGVPPIFWKHP